MGVLGRLGWQRVLVDDETRDLRRAGCVGHAGRRTASWPGSRTERYWLRARLLEDGPPGEPTLNAIYPQRDLGGPRQTIIDEPLGAATGQPGLVLAFRQVPILPGQEIEVRELQGRRADAEWRIVAAGLVRSGRPLQDLETLVGADRRGTDIRYGPLRLVRDRPSGSPRRGCYGRNGRAFGDRARPTGLRRRPGARPGALGDGVHVPARGCGVVARRYQTGGGSAGNVPVEAISAAARPGRRYRDGLQPGAGRGRRRRRGRRSALLARGPRGPRPRAVR